MPLSLCLRQFKEIDQMRKFALILYESWNLLGWFHVFIFACNAKSFSIANIFLCAFACNAKHFAVAFAFLSRAFLGRLIEVFFVFRQLLLEIRLTSNGRDSWTPGQRAMSMFWNFACESMAPCALEINSNVGFPQTHVESLSSTTKNISPLPQSLWYSNPARWWLFMKTPNS